MGWTIARAHSTQLSHTTKPFTGTAGHGKRMGDTKVRGVDVRVGGKKQKGCI
jgi:hypothetical protein